MAGRGRHIRGALWTATTILIAAVAMTLPQRAHAGEWPVTPGALAQAGLAAAQNAVDAATAAVNAAQPAVVTGPAVTVPAITGVAPAVTPAASPRAAAAPAAAPAPTASRPPAVSERAAARVPRQSAPQAAPARAADPPLPVAASAAHAGAVAVPRVPAVSVPAVSVPAVAMPAVAIPTVSMPSVSMPSVSVPQVSVPPVPSLTVGPGMQIPAIAIPWSADWASVFASSAPVDAAPGPLLGGLASTGWPLDVAAAPLSATLPPRLGTSPAAAALTLVGALPRHRHASSGTGHGRRARVHSAARSRAGDLGQRAVAAESWSAPAAGATHRPLVVRVPAPPVPRLRDDGAGSPRPAHPASESSNPTPPLTAPMPGGGAAAAASAGGAGGAAVMLTAAALILIFLLSTRMSLDLSAWRSTLLSLRLERPG